MDTFYGNVPTPAPWTNFSSFPLDKLGLSFPFVFWLLQLDFVELWCRRCTSPEPLFKTDTVCDL